jgi:hypothetical protein
VITVGTCDFIRRIPFTTAKKLFFTVAIIGLPFLLFIIYSTLLKGLSVMEIRECLPYMEGDQPYTTSPWMAISSFLQMTFHTIISNGINFAIAVINITCALRCFYLIIKNKLPVPRNTILILSLGMLCLFYAANSHE